MIILFLTNCRSERSACYRDNNFHVENEDSCLYAGSSYRLTQSTRNNNPENNIIINSYQTLGDILLLDCVNNTMKKKNCDKKSDVVPDGW